MAYYRIDELPCIKEAEEKRIRERQKKGKMLPGEWMILGFIVSSLTPTLCMLLFHDYLFPYEWNPVDYFIMILPMIWGIPLLIGGLECRRKEKEVLEKEGG